MYSDWKDTVKVLNTSSKGQIIPLAIFVLNWHCGVSVENRFSSAIICVISSLLEMNECCRLFIGFLGALQFFYHTCISDSHLSLVFKIPTLTVQGEDFTLRYKKGQTSVNWRSLRLCNTRLLVTLVFSKQLLHKESGQKIGQWI